MVRPRRGRSSFGCLIAVLALVTVIYVGVNIGEPYWRYYEYVDAMRQEARFASRYSDDEIKNHLRAFADSLGLPDEAARVQVRRTATHISISSEYSEPVKLLLVVREILVQPKAEWTL